MGESKTNGLVLLVGNPIDGLTLYGPFHDEEALSREAETIADSDWWSAKLLAPDDAEDAESNLRHAARAVVAAWEKGDLGEMVRRLESVLVDEDEERPNG